MDNLASGVDYFLHRLPDSITNKVIQLAQVKWVQRVMVITAVLLASFASPMLLSSSRLLLFLGLIGAGVALITFMRWPPLGLVALVAASLVLPSPNLPGGFNLTILLLLVLIGLWLLDMIIVQRHVWFVASRPVKPLLLLVPLTAVSLLFGQLTWFRWAESAPLDAQLGGFAIFIASVGAFLLAAQQIRKLYWLQWMTWLYIALGTLFVAGWLVPGVGSFTGRIFQLGATSNSLFWTWLVALAFGQVVFNKKLHPAWRVILLGIVAATLYVAYVFNHDWKSGYLPPMAAIATILALRNWRFGLIMLLVAPFASYFLTSEAIATDEYSFGTRVDAWLILFEIIKVSPLIGLGPANYYWYTPLFPIRGWFVSFNSHNQFVDIVAQIGLVGLVVVIWFAVEQALLGWRIREKAPEGFAKAYVYGALGGLVGMMVGGMLADWFFPFVYNIGMYGFRGAIPGWLFLGGLVAVEKMIEQEA